MPQKVDHRKELAVQQPDPSPDQVLRERGCFVTTKRNALIEVIRAQV
jgi:hypothetical protein